MENLPDVEWTDEALSRSPALGAFMDVLVQVPMDDRRELISYLLKRLEGGLEAKIISERRRAHV